MDNTEVIIQKYSGVQKLFPDIDLVEILSQWSFVNDALIKLDQSLDEFYSRVGYSEDFLKIRKNRDKLSIEDHDKLLRADDFVNEMKFMQHYLLKYYEEIENCRVELEDHLQDVVRKKYKKIFQELENAKTEAFVNFKAQEALSQEIVDSLKEGTTKVNKKRLLKNYKRLIDETFNTQNNNKVDQNDNKSDANFLGIFKVTKVKNKKEK